MIEGDILVSATSCLYAHPDVAGFFVLGQSGARSDTWRETSIVFPIDKIHVPFHQTLKITDIAVRNYKYWTEGFVVVTCDLAQMI
jgi:hypothetical protein